MNINDYRLKAYKKASAEPEVDKSEVEDSVITGSQKTASHADPKNQALKEGGLLKVPGEIKESVHRRVAKFLVLIGSDAASQVLKLLPEEDTEKIIPEIAMVRYISPEEAAAIYEEFHTLVDRIKDSGGRGAAYDILQKAFGTYKADALLEKAAPEGSLHPFQYLEKKTPDQILTLLKNENPQVAAIVLSHLNPKTAAGVINKMEKDQKKDVVLRLAKMEKINPQVLESINKTMEAKAKALKPEEKNSFDGSAALAEILKRMDVKSGQDLLSTLTETDPQLANNLKKNLFTLDDVLKMNDRFLQEHLRTMSDGDIAFLIADKDEAFRKRIFESVSTGRGDQILEEEAARKPMLKSDCEKITSQFLSVLRAAYTQGKFILKGEESDDIYV